MTADEFTKRFLLLEAVQTDYEKLYEVTHEQISDEEQFFN